MHRVVVVGGGLAGMVAARAVARSGREVTILEHASRLGGKAGANAREGRLVEHGYHVFPMWYPNVRALLKEIGVTLVDFDRYHYLRPGEYPKRITVKAPTGLGPVLYNLTHGLVPWYETVLFYNFTLDLISRKLSQKRLLDLVSEVGLMRQAWYVTEAVAALNQENLLKASAIPAYEMSAMTAKKIGGFWMRQAAPFLSVLPGDLQSTFIEPLAKTVTDAGAKVRFGAEVTGFEIKDGKVKAALLAGGERVEADAFVLAVPFEVARRFVNDELYALDPSLGNMHLLESRPMSALHVRLKKRILDLPREHVFFHGGAYGLSFIDVAPLWGKSEGSELSFIASNFAPLAGLSQDGATASLLGEIEEYLPPVKKDDIVDTVLNTNVSTPLFINTIGAWQNRPSPNTRAPNLVVAGDFAKNGVDLACMEGAVGSALAAARALLAYLGETNGLPHVEEPPTPSRALLLAMRAGFSPFVVAAYVAARVAETVRPKQPISSNAKRRQGGKKEPPP